MRGWKNIFHENESQKKIGVVAILLSDKIDLKNIARDKERHYIIIKGSSQKEDVIIVNIYSPKMRAPQHIRQTLSDKKRRN